MIAVSLFCQTQVGAYKLQGRGGFVVFSSRARGQRLVILCEHITLHALRLQNQEASTHIHTPGNQALHFDSELRLRSIGEKTPPPSLT